MAADGRIALVRRLGAESELLLLSRSLRSQRLFSAFGSLTDVAWSPGGAGSSSAGRGADQWLFLRPGGAKVPAYSDIARQFASQPGTFPSIAPQGWCCPG